MKKIVIATKNQGKLREMRQAFAHLPVEVVALDAFAEVPEPVEDGGTATYTKTNFDTGEVAERHVFQVTGDTYTEVTEAQS